MPSFRQAWGWFLVRIDVFLGNYDILDSQEHVFLGMESDLKIKENSTNFYESGDKDK